MVIQTLDDDPTTIPGRDGNISRCLWTDAMGKQTQADTEELHARVNVESEYIDVE